MKKHPIDDLFKKKLDGVERTPSADAWDRIRPVKEEKRLPLLAWYMAAGVVVTLLAGYMMWMSEAGNVGSELAAKTSLPAEDKTIVNPSVTVDNLPTGETSRIAKSPEKSIEKIQVPQKEHVSEKSVAQPMIAAVESVTKKETQTVDTSLELSYPEIEPVREIASVTPVVQNETENRTIVVNVSEPKMEIEQEKSSRLSKIFRQLKNVKHGESVDWKEVGFNPREVVARVDGRLRDGEEKVSEKYQNLKERTKF